MASSAELTFAEAVTAAEGVRQAAKAAALATWAYGAGSALTTYITALSDADVAYFNSVKTALDTSNLALGNAGQSGPIAGGYSATIAS